MTWANQTPTVAYSLTAAPGGPSSPITGAVEYIENYKDTGRNLIRITFAKSAFASAGFYTLSPPTGGNALRVAVPTGLMTYNNEARTYVQGIGQETSPLCGPGTTTAASTIQSRDPLDLDGDGELVQNSCSSSASLSVPANVGPDFRLVKTVKGDLDDDWKGYPGIGEAAENGTGEFTLKWTNIGSDDLDDPVIYDILPYVGDTGTTQGQVWTNRGSAFQPEFEGLTQPLPAGVGVEYSTSANPCRNEVFPDAANAGCDPAWSPSPPADLKDVRALRFRASGTYRSGDHFAVTFGVRVPEEIVNVVAWNSGATTAKNHGSGTWRLASEPPKVGLRAPAPPAVATLSTAVSEAAVTPGDAFSDTIRLRDTGGASGDIDWQLVGPQPIGADGTCDAVDWTGAALFDSGTIAFAGDGDYDTPTSAPTGAGCYSYVVEADGVLLAGPVGHPAGAADEVVLVRPATIVTAASSLRIAPDAEVTDRVDLTGTGGGAGTLEWELVGPIPAAADGTCLGLDWTGAATFDQGTIAVSGDGRYDTSPSKPTETGCYSYVQKLTAASAGGPAISPAGTIGETVYVGRPTVTTTISSASILSGGSLADSIEVRGTGGGAGTLSWKLYGPTTPGPGNTCLGLNWAGAAVVAQGTIAITGDGTSLTPPSTVLSAGCYGYEVTLTGDDYGDPVVSPAGTPGELALVSMPAVPSAQANVSIAKTASSRNVKAGSPVTYTLTATNTGPGAAADVVVTDTPKSAMTFVSAKPEQGSCTTRFPVECRLGTIAPGARVAIKVVAIPKVSGAMVNDAKVTTTTPNTSPATEVVASARVNVKVPLRLTKRASVRTVKAGGRMSYTVTVANRTKLRSSPARVCDRMPSGLVLVSVSGTRVKRQNGAHCWTAPALDPGKTKRYRINVRVLRGASGTKVNRVTVSGTGTQTATARASVQVRATRVRPGGVTG